MNRTEKLTYLNEKGQSVEFSIQSPFFCTDLTGQDGIKNTIYTSKGAGQDGTTVTGDNLEPRNIVVQGIIREDRERNRSGLLSICNPKLKSKLIYINGGVEKYIDCKVEKAPTITKEKYPKFLISFYCANPYWQDTTEAKAEIALWVGDFSFPLEIISAGIEMGHRISTASYRNTWVYGSVPTTASYSGDTSNSLRMDIPKGVINLFGNARFTAVEIDIILNQTMYNLGLNYRCYSTEYWAGYCCLFQQNTTLSSIQLFLYNPGLFQVGSSFCLMGVE